MLLVLLLMPTVLLFTIPYGKGLLIECMSFDIAGEVAAGEEGWDEWVGSKGIDILLSHSEFVLRILSSFCRK